MNTAQYYARAIINRVPGLSDAQVRMAVLDKTGLRITEYQINAIRRNVRRTGKLSADKSSYGILVSEGWTATEARKLLEGLHVSIDSPVVMAMRRTRVNWHAMLMGAGMTHKDIMRDLENWYAKTDKYDPFVFLRREYRPPFKLGRTEYQAAAKRRASRSVATLYRKRPSRPRGRPINFG